MPWYRVRLRLVDVEVSSEQIDALDRVGGLAYRRGNEVSVTLEAVNAGDPAGALARTQNLVLDLVPSNVQHAEVTLTKAPERPNRRWVRRQR